jgi:hypothetical protein
LTGSLVKLSGHADGTAGGPLLECRAWFMSAVIWVDPPAAVIR